ncbi:hypothetical protein CMU99_06860 [Elizabethkingia anophelis]|nr:hypothetical protein [Elizabethkingia anophelis]
MEKFLEVIRNQAAKSGSVKYQTSIGTVVAISGMTCTVSREDLPDLEDVRLSAIDQSFDDQILIYPKIGSQVLCLVVENEAAETAIVKYTEVEKVIMTISGAKFEMSGGKFEISNQESSLKKILSEGFDQLKNAIITTPSGPGKFSTADKLKFNELKEASQALLK